MTDPLTNYTSDKLCDYEVSLLKELVTGEDQGLSWGAAMSVCMETLQGMGYLTRGMNVVPTQKGINYINNLSK